MHRMPIQEEGLSDIYMFFNIWLHNNIFPHHYFSKLRNTAFGITLRSPCNAFINRYYFRVFFSSMTTSISRRVPNRFIYNLKDKSKIKIVFAKIIIIKA